MSLGDVAETFKGFYDGIVEKYPFIPVLIILAIIALIGTTIFFMSAPLEEKNVNVTIEVRNEAGVPVAGVDIKLSGEEELSAKTDSSGKAVFSVMEGSIFEAKAVKENYYSDKKSFTAEKNMVIRLGLSPFSETSKEVTLTFVGPDSKKLVGKTIDVKLACTSGAVLEQDSFKVTTGELKIVPPNGCGSISVIAGAANFSTQNTTVLGVEGIIRLSGIEKPRGSVKIIVRELDSNRFLDRINVKLMNQAGVLVKPSSRTSFGEVTFEGVETGSYTALIEDPNEAYGSSSAVVEVEDSLVSQKTVFLSKDIKLRSKIVVQKKGSSEKIGGALVELFDDANVLIASKETDSKGEAAFVLSDSGTYYYMVSKENFLGFARKDFATSAYEKGSTQEFVAELDECSAEKCGSLVIRVVDDEGLAVENAVVMLVNEDGFIVANQEKATDFNGFTGTFTGLGLETYRVIAQKYPSQTTSEEFTIDPLEENFFEMILLVGNGSVLINAKDIDNEAVEFAVAEVYSDSGALLGEVNLDADGKGVLEKVRADKKVFVTVKKDGYSSYTSVARQVFDKKTITFNAVLEKEILGDRPLVEFLGLFNKNGSRAGALEAGKKYDAKFLVSIPTAIDADRLGLFVRAGEKEKVEEDVIFVDSVNAPSASIMRGKNYSPNRGSVSETQGQAKWVSIVVNNPAQGTYEFEAEIRIRESAPKESYLPVFYRTWVEEGSLVLRDPVDGELGTGFETASKKGIYAESYEASFYEGIEALCSTDFCFSENILDKREGLFITQPYSLRTYSDYEINFSMRNNTSTVYDEAAFSIRNTADAAKTAGDLSINSYSIRNADSQEFSSETGAFEIGAFSSGRLGPQKTISGTLVVEPKTTNASSLEFRVVSNQNMVFQKFVTFANFYENEINVSAEPETLFAYVPIDLNVKAVYKDGDYAGFGAEDAKIIVTKTAPDKSQTIFNATTNDLGEATLSLPASSPGTKISITLEKEGYYANEVVREISNDVVSVSPEKLVNSISLITNEEAKGRLSIANSLPISIVLEKVRITGQRTDIVDTAKMQKFVKGFEGTTINPNEVIGIDVLSAIGSEAQSLDKGIIVEQKIILEFGVPGNNDARWVKEIPFETIVNLAELPSNGACLSISIKDWKDATLGNKAEIEFEIQNNCITESGNPIELDNLVGKINWTGSDGILGQVELSVTNPETGDVYSEVLQKDLWSRMSSNVKQGTIYPAKLVFVPKADSIGKTAKFFVSIDASLRTNAGDELVGSSNDISAEILIINLDQCVRFTPETEEGIEIGKNSLGEEFTIDTSECGPIDLDIRFCEGGANNCTTVIGAGVMVSPWKFTGLREETKTVKVNRLIVPGFYDVKVEAKPKGGSWRKVGTMGVTIRPGTGHFSLDKYEFSIIGKGSKDSAILTNTMVLEDVQVKASVCDWDEASEDKEAWQGNPMAAMGGGALAGVAAGWGVAALTGFTGLFAPVFAGLAWCPVCVVVGIVVAIVVAILMMFLSLFGVDPCDEDATHTLKDYVINLPGTVKVIPMRFVLPDAIDIMVNAKGISGHWNIGVADGLGDLGINGQQKVGVLFENTGAKGDEAVYGMVTAIAREHVHGDPTHLGLANVKCEGSNFGMFWINALSCRLVYDTIYTQKFHAKFKVAEEEAPLPDITFDTQECQSGTTIGRTGKGALPRVKLNWSWRPELGGIGDDTCDASNPEYVYCDATQFTISLNKKIKNLYEFLKANNYDLSCPQAQLDMQALITQAVMQSELGLDAGPLLTKISESLDIDTTLTSDNPIVALALEEAGYGTTDFDCRFKTTETYAGKPLILEFVKAKEPFVTWTDDVPNKEALENLLIFDAYLMKDNYTEDFFGDFSKHYTENEFEDADSYFTEISADADGKYGFNRLLEKNLFLVTRKYVESGDLPGPGLYNVEISAYFSETDWRFFDNDGTPRVGIAVVVYRKEEAYPNSPFYSMPIDGLVGLEGNSFERQGYGTAFTNITEEELMINNDAHTVKTFSDDASNPVSTVSTKVERGFYALNTSPSTRGMILRVENQGTGVSSIVFQPSQATPVVLKVSKEKAGEENFGAYYSILENLAPIDIGDTLTYWSGAGNCLDFSGVPVNEAFYEKPDRAANADDALQDPANYYTVNWEANEKTGDVYLRTIFYSDPEKDFVLNAENNPEVDAELLTPDQDGKNVSLNGIAGMPFNNYASGAAGTIKSIQDVFRMVDEGNLCVTNSGTTTKFWWNPQSIYSAQGLKRSISDFTNELETGDTCIG